MNSLLSVLDGLIEHSLVKQVKQVRPVIPIEQWLESPFYCGHDGVRSLYDTWKDHLSNIFNKKYSEVILTGSLGSGKSTVADYCLIRKIYEISCYSPIPFLFNMMESTIIEFFLFSVTMKQAESTGFGKIRRIMDDIPYFQKYFQRNKEKNSMLEFQNLRISYGSEVGHQLGVDLCGSVMDESNFMGTDHTHIVAYDKATMLYNSIVNRRLNRFVVENEDLGLSIIVSSAADPTSFVETRIKEAEKDDKIYIANVAAYEVKRKQYAKEEFCIFTGSDLLDPCVVETNDTLKKVLLGLNYDIDEVDWRLDVTPIVKRHLPEYVSIRFKFIPQNFRKLADLNIEKFIQDVVGYSTTEDNKLYKNRDLYNQAVTGSTNLFVNDKIILKSTDETRISDYISFSFDNVSMPRYIHVDQAYTRDTSGKVQNRCGLACCYISKYEKVNDMVVPFITFDWLLVIDPPERPDQIPFWKIWNFIIWLRDKGLNIGQVSFDGFQSIAGIQVLNQNNIKSITYSVDKTDQDWLTLVGLFYEQRIKLPHHKEFAMEIFNVEHDKERHKVDHARGMYKDLADAVVGSAANCLANTQAAIYNLQQFAAQEETATMNIYELMRRGTLPL